MKPTLKEWHITKYQKDDDVSYHAFGDVYGHTDPKFSDGTLIHTSRIKNIELSDENTLQLQTYGSFYCLKLSEYGTMLDINNAAAGKDYSRSVGDFTIEALRDFGI